MKHIWTDGKPCDSESDKRKMERRDVELPARLTWKDHRGAMRFASVVTRNISDHGVYVESDSPISIPLYRLVQLQLERHHGREPECLPMPLRRHDWVLSAVYRLCPATDTRRHGLALRLMVEPARVASGAEADRATA